MKISRKNFCQLIWRISEKIFLSALRKFDDTNQTVTTYRVKRLALSKDLTSARNFTRKSIGILIQGQLIPGVTTSICMRYKALYPNSVIVFSTWAGQESGEMNKIRALGVAVIENEFPKFRGPSNVNLQIVSTKSGLKFLASKKVELVLKNRSDGLLSSDYLFEYLLFLYEIYSEDGKRIVVPGYNSFLFRLYSPTDQFQFGSLETLQEFWNCELVEGSDFEFRFPESYLVRSYLRRQGKTVDFTIQDSLSIYRDHFIIADNAALGLVLNKGTRSDVSNRWANDGFPQTFSELHFWIWLDLNSDISKYVKMYEELSDKPIY